MFSSRVRMARLVARCSQVGSKAGKWWQFDSIEVGGQVQMGQTRPHAGSGAGRCPSKTRGVLGWLLCAEKLHRWRQIFPPWGKSATEKSPPTCCRASKQFAAHLFKKRRLHTNVLGADFYLHWTNICTK